ncbi:branched-chain amino acid ABC transporter substrate-binding protein (plasmid) [Pararhizobium polonicum]|uniref:Branched-chain amino acid ABC transporter substrate-binding protein n=2 Tax=Pararhizobium polonicum TaxID=1612624 RepID=A0A1C7P8C5_9HYPH|nr:branched-chain amino acid ABC transporter substrate-binding protein [Pararhizobium polonicum]
MTITKSLLSAGILLGSTAIAHADVSVCALLSITGPASALGAPQQSSVQFLPKEIDGKAVKYIVLDDATDPGAATQNARKCLAEQKADVLIGGAATPVAAALAAVAAETGTPFLAIGPVGTKDEQFKWTFVVPQPVSLMAKAIVEHMKTRGVKTVGFIGYSDAYGDLWLNAISPLLKAAGITVGPVERFARNDTSVAAQALKVASARPDAVLVVASGAPAAGPNLALADRGYGGAIYHTHGSASPAFLKVGGAAANGTLLPVGPIVVASQLDDSNSAKAPALKYTTQYEAAFGAGSVSPFGGYLIDSGLIIAAAASTALKSGSEPGTPEFRAALRTAIENLNGVPGVHGSYSGSAKIHDLSSSDASRVMAVVQNGAWKIAK